MSERSGVEIDYCPQCRGVWLDRGELDRIIERSAPGPQPAGERPYEPPRSEGHRGDDGYRGDGRDRRDGHGERDRRDGHGDRDRRDGYGDRRRRREGLFGDLFR